MTVIHFSSILSHDLFNTNFRNTQEEGVNMTIHFLLVPILSDLRSYDINCPPVPASVSIYIDMDYMS